MSSEAFPPLEYTVVLTNAVELSNLDSEPQEATRMEPPSSATEPPQKKCRTSRVGPKKPPMSAVISATTGNKATPEQRDAAALQVVHGSFHQGGPTVSALARGKMCTACALISLCYAAHVPHEAWQRETVDSILLFGDQFYRKVIEARSRRSPHVNDVYLNAEEVTHPDNNRFALRDIGQVFTCTELVARTVYGYLRAEQGQMLALQVGLARFFRDNRSGMIVCASQTMALFRVVAATGETLYCLVDSHSRYALPDLSGNDRNNAFLMKCVSLNTLSDVLLRIFRHSSDHQRYTLVPIEIERVPMDTVQVPEGFTFGAARPDVEERAHSRTTSTARPTRMTTRSSTAATRNEINVAVAHATTSSERRATTRQPSTAVPANSAEGSYLGRMTVECAHCCALRFRNETESGCCQKGEVRLPEAVTYPEFFKALLVGDHPDSKAFLQHVRAYNSNIAMASVRANYSAPSGRGPPVIIISGIFHHCIADVTRTDPKFGSVYICAGDVDPSCNDVALNLALVRELRSELRRINPFVGLYRQMGELIDSTDGSEIREGRLFINFYLNPTTDRRRYNAPTDPNEIGAVFSSGDGQVPSDENSLRIYYRDVTNVRNDSTKFSDISRTSAISDPLCYPLLFPSGELGWSTNVERSNAARKSRKRISMLEFYSHKLQVRRGTFNPLLAAGRLTQQYVVDCYVKIEGDRLNFLRRNQEALRAESYAGLLDYVRRRSDNNEPLDVGRVIVLPSTFQGGHRFMVGNYQDSMSMIARYGKPSLFITFTCNTRWPEIRNNLDVNQIPSDRPDLTVRVFHEKLKMLMHDLVDKSMFGRVVSWVYVVEFQKRGLPHAHVSITVCEESAPKTADDIDAIISAELPDGTTHPELFRAVTEMMVHGPCGEDRPDSPCMVDGKCRKNFPIPLVSDTELSDGKVTYRRRIGEPAIVSGGRLVDNGWVIPYNPQLLLKYDAHINVLYVASVGCVKYLFKYITKGHDAALYQIGGQRANAEENAPLYDEINDFIESRYVSACESMWRIFKMPLFSKSHTVVRLPVHLPDEKQVYFHENDDLDVVMERADQQVSLLEGYFRLNGHDEFARTLHYAQIPEHYTFSNKTWRRRQRRRNTIGRIYTINPKAVEKFHLRILLLHVKGATSYEDLLDPRDGSSAPCTTFREAARRRLLVGGCDLEWERTLEEYWESQTAGQLRKMFCYLLKFCEVVQPRDLYDKFRDRLMDDYVTRRHLPGREAERRCLVRMERFMAYLGDSLLQYDFANLFADLDVSDAIDSESTHGDDQNVDDDEDQRALRAADLAVEADVELATLNDGQRRVFQTVWNAVAMRSAERTAATRCFFLQGCGGTGKTFLYNVLLKRFEAAGVSCVAVALTGIAALLLHKGRTAHSSFKLPLDINAQSSSAVSNGSAEAGRLKNVKLIIWDEISMCSHFMVDAVDRLFRQLHGEPSLPFGGVCVLLGGDLRQLLPVNRYSVGQMEQTFLNCTAWPSFQVLELTENLRADPDAMDFAEWLLELGDGNLRPTERVQYKLPAGSVEVPQQCVTDDVVADIYGDLASMDATDRPTALSDRMVLCPLNRTCDAINDRLIDVFPGQATISVSVDDIETDDVNDRIKYQQEVLNARDHSGMPKHILRLKVGVPVILLRNISIRDGLVNGTRMIVRSVTTFLLTAEIVSGTHRGEIRSIPRMDLSSRDQNFPFTLKRRQFPVRVCFAMTINKSQGQTFRKVGIYLPEPVFAFGQLYVAFSRAKSFASVRVQVENTSVQGRLMRKSTRVFTRNLAPVELLRRLRSQQLTR